MIGVAQITSADWSCELDWTADGGIQSPAAATGDGFGEVVQGVDDIAQCLAIIFSTPRGSDVLRPTFGADLWKYLDRPINRAIPAIVREAADALQWEPRINVISLSAAPVLDGGVQSGAKLTLSVTWQLKLGGPAQTTRVTLGRAASA